MKHKNLRVICAAACLCIASVLSLLGCMGKAAEKSGSADLDLTIMESEASDTLANVLAEADVRNAKGLRSDEELKEIWDQLFLKYAGSDYYRPIEEVNRMYWDQELETYTFLDTEQMEGERTDTSGSVSGYSAKSSEEEVESPVIDDAALDASEAGLILLREIDWLYPDSDLAHLFIIGFQQEEIDMGEEHPLAVKWTGLLENVYAMYDKNYISYNFEMDAITGKISYFSCFYPYDPEKNYTDIAWTDEQILERAKELVETYHMDDGETLDWSGAKVDNATENIASMQQDLERKDENGLPPSISIRNSVIFFKEGKEYFNLSMDFETGNLVEYYWPDFYRR